MRRRYTVSGYTDTLTELESFYSQLEGATAGSEAVSDLRRFGSDESKVNDVSGVGSAAADDADGVSAFARVGNAAPYWGGSKANGPDNMALVLGVSTFDHYSSTQEYRIQQLLHDLGYSKVTPFGTYYMSSNVIADALLGVTDIVDDQPPAAAEPEEAVLRGTWRAYRNELALPLGWGTTGSAHVDRQEGRPLDNQDAMLADAADNDASALSAVDVQECDGDQDARTYTLTPSADGPVYLYTPTAFVNDLYYEGGIVCELRVDGSLVQTIGGRGSCNQVHPGAGGAPGNPCTGGHQAACRTALRAALRGRHRDERAVRVLGCSRQRADASRHRGPANPEKSAVAHRFRRFCAHGIREWADYGHVQRRPRRDAA